MKCWNVQKFQIQGIWAEFEMKTCFLRKSWKKIEKIAKLIKMSFSMECLMADIWRFFSRNVKICRNVKSVCILISSLLLKAFFLSFTVDKSYPSLLNLSCNFCSISSLFKVLLYCPSILLTRCLLSLTILIYFSILLTFKQFYNIQT